MGRVQSKLAHGMHGHYNHVTGLRGESSTKGTCAFMWARGWGEGEKKALAETGPRPRAAGCARNSMAKVARRARRPAGRPARRSPWRPPSAM